MARLSIHEIYDAAIAAGFSPHQAVTWTAIALAESGGNPKAHNPNGEDSRGLWQVNVRADSSRSTQWGNLYHPRANAEAAYAISNRGRDMRPWTTTHDTNKGTAADYRTYLAQVESAVGVRGDHRGVHGYGSALPDPLPNQGLGTRADRSRSTAPEAVVPQAAVTTKAAELDTDGDGLTDSFEALAGSNPAQRDTDRDGLTDGHEALVTHTDLRSGDTDDDGVSDPAEVAAGTDAGRIAGLGGVVGSGIFRERAAQATDPDHDGLSSRTEKLIGTDEKKSDTDGDNLNDAMEASLGTNPLRMDSDLDGLVDGLEVSHARDPLTPQGAGSSAERILPWTLEQGAADQARQTHPVTEPTGNQADGSALATFLRLAEAQQGDAYGWGATPKSSTADPASFDCSSLVQWAAGRAGVRLDRTAEQQYRQLKGEGTLISVDRALHTPGALLFRFSEEPLHGQLSAGDAHVVISLGDGEHVVEARNSQSGVGVWSAKGRGFNYAAEIPGLSDSASVEAFRADREGTDPPQAPAAAPRAGRSATPYGMGKGRAVEESVRVDHDRPSKGDLKPMTFRGETVDRRTGSMLKEAERIAQAEDPSIPDFRLAQGSWSHARASAGTHGGPGAFDMDTAAYTGEQKDIIGLALRRVGFASWRRRTSEGGWEEHWHGIAIGTPGLPQIAKNQVESYLSGHNGLRGNGVDHDKRPADLLTWEQYQALAPDGGRDGPGDAPATRAGKPAGRGASNAGVTGTGVLAGSLRTGKDTDADGLTDRFEKLVGTDLDQADSDGDQVSDAMEASLGTDPTIADSDFDGLTDGLEIEQAGDPLTPTVDAAGRSVPITPWTAETAYGAATGALTDPASSYGIAHGGAVSEASRLPGAGASDPDTDRDGLTNAFEKLLKSSLTDADSDHDGIEDGLEVLRHTDPQRADSDRDRLTDAMELSLGTDPTEFDLDHDGLSDGFEVEHHSDPFLAGAPDQESSAADDLGAGLDHHTGPADLPL